MSHRSRNKRRPASRPSRATITYDEHTLEISIEEIDPLTAEIYLGHNDRNRRLTRGQVYRLAGALRRDEWCLNGETIVFDSAGDLTDGQHRLRGIINADKPMLTVVVRGVEPRRAQDTTGTGIKRTLGGQLSVHEEENAPTLAAAIMVVHKLTVERNWAGSYPTNLQGLEILRLHPKLREACIIGGRANRSVLKYSSGTATALYYLFTTVDDQDAKTFWMRLMVGDLLESGDPIHALRQAMLKDTNRPKSQARMTQRNRVALTIKAWVLWRQGEECKQLRWRPGGSRAEPWPQFDEEVIVQ